MNNDILRTSDSREKSRPRMTLTNRALLGVMATGAFLGAVHFIEAPVTAVARGFSHRVDHDRSFDTGANPAMVNPDDLSCRYIVPKGYGVWNVAQDVRENTMYEFQTLPELVAIVSNAEQAMPDQRLDPGDEVMIPTVDCPVGSRNFHIGQN